MKTILIGGYYGANNLGDDAILESMLSALHKRQSDLRIVVAAFKPDLIEEQFLVESVNWRHITELVKSVQEADLVLVGGGGLFQDYWGIDTNSYFRNIHGGITTYGSLIKLAKLFGKPCMAYAVGIGPLQSPEAREQTAELLKACAVITLRDNDSYNLLKEIGLDFTELTISIQADPVFSLQPDEEDFNEAFTLLSEIPRDTEAPIMAVSVRYWDKEVPQEVWTESLAQQLDVLIERTGAHLLFTPFQKDAESNYTDDFSVSRHIYSKLRSKNHASLLNKILSPSVMQALYAQCNFVAGMRLHSIIMALNAKKPVLAIAYDPKILALMQPLGLGSFTVPMEGIGDSASQILGLMGQGEIVSSKIASFLPELNSLANENADIALALLHKDRRAYVENMIPFIQDRLAQMEYMDDDLTKAKTNLADLQAEIDRLATENLFLKDRMQQIENSRSWRAMEPLRKLYAALFSKSI